MSQSLSSFLISVSIIIAMSLFVPCIESIAKLIKRNAEKQRIPQPQEQAKPYRREAA